jgi:hypothetical protein
MRWEHWESTDSDGTPSDLFLPSDSPKHAYLTAGHILMWTVEAESHEEAMTLFHVHMGWEPYVPFPPPDSN